MTSRFISAQATGPDWRQVVGTVLAAIAAAGPHHRLGIVYVTPHFAEELAQTEVILRQATGVPHWIGTVGYGTIGTTARGTYEEIFGAPGLSVLLCPFDDDDFRVFSSLRGESDRITNIHAGWLGTTVSPAILTHGDPSNGLLGGLLEDIVHETEGFLIGGLSALQGPGSQIANGLDGQGLSGALIA